MWSLLGLALVSVCCTILSAGALASPARAPRPRQQVGPDEQRQVREALREELRPVALKNCTIKRFGSANDGGYIHTE